ncbi:FMN-binding protein [Floccifex sp.]|uniref:FMN-binding protein n=1 Tax=Floccifex sp. TaxID=2815810 RepID=UPI002A76368D|nr:FMN-binding protein [Floccifex sp.]MDD7281138.1 FMN-binding protein [Erysipelotrichaceae bacterium]MDY2958062.1 FMN-binding protein [Floccifex sp.]
MKKAIHLGVFLAVVSAIAGGALSYVNGITSPIIEENKLAVEKESLLVMYPEATADDFEIVDGVSTDTITKVYKYNDFYIFNLVVSGYKEGTTFLVSIDSNTEVIDKYQPLSNGDTKGIGSKVMDEPFKTSLEGKVASEQLDTISGATVSSTPVVKGINEACEVMKGLK